VNKFILSQEEWLSRFDPRHINNLFTDHGQDVRSTIFHNPVNHWSMRLTQAGFYYLKNVLEIESYEFKLSKKITPLALVQLEKYIQYPYFIHNLKKIHVFDESTAIMLSLHGNDLETYLSNLENHQ